MDITQYEDVTDQFRRELVGGHVPGYLHGLKPMAEPTSETAKQTADMVNGMRLAFISKAPVYGDAIKKLNKNQHKALIRLLLGGYVRLLLVPGPLPDAKVNEVGGHARYHYMLTIA